MTPPADLRERLAAIIKAEAKKYPPGYDLDDGCRHVADAILAWEEWRAREAETMASIAVVAAVIPDEDGALYVQWRSDKQATGWNFPGGKVEVGETLEAALIREIQEECGVTVKLTRHLATGCVRYAKGVHAVHFFETAPVARESIRHLEGHHAAWVDRDTVGAYSFLELDGQVALARLDAGKEEETQGE